MVSKVILLSLLVTAVVASTRVRGNIAVGDEYGSHLIYHEIHDKVSLPFIVRDEDITVKALENETITAIFVTDLEGGATSYISSGGVGKKEVTIHLNSKRGSGYRFLVEVYAA